jgi:hypothetical protein
MSSTAAALTNDEYEERKICWEELKRLVKSEQEQIYRILKRHRVELSENSNGVFFDLSRCSSTAFQEIQSFLRFCQDNRQDFAARDRDMEASRQNLGEALAFH